MGQIAVQTTTQLLQYYSNLLIMQYLGRQRAVATTQLLASTVFSPQTSVQTISFSPVPTGGAFTLYYGAAQTASIAWNANPFQVQSALTALTGLSGVTVSGLISSGTVTVTFGGVPAPATLLYLGANTLTSASGGVVPTIIDTDFVLPLAVQNAFNLLGSPTAVGKQLDIIGKYVGVTRYGVGTLSNITLSDADFISLIKLATIENTSTADLYSIQALLNQFFAGQIAVYDYQNMRLSYSLSTAIGSADLVTVLVTQKLLPRPMGVQLSVVYAPTVNQFFGFRTYTTPEVNSTGFNTYATPGALGPWLSDANVIVTSN